MTSHTINDNFIIGITQICIQESEQENTKMFETSLFGVPK